MTVIWIIAGMALLFLLLARDGPAIRKPHVSRYRAPDRVTGTDQQVKQLLESDQKIKAIKLYRKIHRVGLKEAKQAVEQMEHDDPADRNTRLLQRSNRASGLSTDGKVTQPSGQGTDEQVKQLVQAHQKIKAIKLYREIHGVGLKEAKDAVEQMEL